VVLIASCKAYAAKCDAVRETWLRDLPAAKGFQAFFVVGEPGVPTHLKGDTLFVDVDDTYEALPLKILRAIGWVHHSMDPDFVFKCDDDTYLCLPRLCDTDFCCHHYYGLDFREFLHSLIPSYLPNSVKRAFFAWFHPVPFAPGGAGYMLSRQAMQAVCSFRASLNGDELPDRKWPTMVFELDIPSVLAGADCKVLAGEHNSLANQNTDSYPSNCLGEDTLIGAILAKQGIKLTHEPRFETGRTFRLGPSRIANCVSPTNSLITSHNLSAAELRVCHDLLHSPALAALADPAAAQAAWHRVVISGWEGVEVSVRQHIFLLRWASIAPKIWWAKLWTARIPLMLAAMKVKLLRSTKNPVR